MLLFFCFCVVVVIIITFYITTNMYVNILYDVFFIMCVVVVVVRAVLFLFDLRLRLLSAFSLTSSTISHPIGIDTPKIAVKQFPMPENPVLI